MPSPTMIGVDASRSFGARPTGTEHYATELTRAMALQAPGRLRLYFRDPPVFGPPAGVEIRILPGRRLWTHRRLAMEVFRDPPGLLFVPAHVLPLPCRPPAVVTVHDLGFAIFPRAHPPARRWYLAASTRWHVHRADHLLADSACTRDDLVRLYGARADKITVVSLAPDADLGPRPEAVQARARAELGLPEGAPFLLHVGTLQPRKNLARLLDAFAIVLNHHPDLHLVLSGAPGWGGAAADLARQADRLGLGRRLRLAGYLPRERLAAAYSAATALVMPSLYEGFGLPVVEAMACGCPVVCSATSSLPEAAGGAAVLVDPLDSNAIAAALVQVLVDADLRLRLREAGLARAARLSWPASAAATLDALERIAAAARRQPRPRAGR